MNFVDVQPSSFLDYAWTTPSPAPILNAKPSKTGRKQNRCCDQCRKGKRACDAAILEDTLLDNNSTPAESPTVFHYSDVFGPLAACANCEKTKKTCTFDWLRSQRVLQATPHFNGGPPTKRRRKSSTSRSLQYRQETAQHSLDGEAPQSTTLPELGPTNVANPMKMKTEAVEFSPTFADFPGQIPVPTISPTSPIREGREHKWDPICFDQMCDIGDADQTPELEHDSGKGSSIETLSDGMHDIAGSESPASSITGMVANVKAKEDDTTVISPRKRRRRSVCSTVAPKSTEGSPSYLNDFLSRSNNAILQEGLLKIYHDSFEDALSCWLTERTCPYSKSSEVSLAPDQGPDWGRIYHRVFRLDQLAVSIRGRSLTFLENKAAARALNLAIFAFATQWTQSSERTRTKFPFHNGKIGDVQGTFGDASVDSVDHVFDRDLQISAWREARLALQQSTEIDSFRIVLAQLVFSLTQRPTELRADVATSDDRAVGNVTTCSIDGNGSQSHSPQVDTSRAEALSDTQFEDLLSKLRLTIDQDGPPVHLQQGLRLIHSLRSRMAMCGGEKPAKRNCRRYGKPAALGQLEAADKATVDLLFWLGVMFDTLSSAMYRRPLVVSDEDSDIYTKQIGPETVLDCVDAKPEEPSTQDDGYWDKYLFACRYTCLKSTLVRWPCSYAQISSLLCDAAPVKVLLFRKLTRIQTLLTRGASGQRIDEAVNAALKVYNYWEKVYAPLISDCIENHDCLPPRVQSWYICISGHWHLATLLLADLIDIIDNAEISTELHRNNRLSANCVARLRRRNCIALSDIASCICPGDDAMFPESANFRFAGQRGFPLTEPWTAVLIRAFATAGTVLLEYEEKVEDHDFGDMVKEDLFGRADICVQALWYLGRRSDMAHSAAKILGSALKHRQKHAEEKVSDMSSLLEADLWDDVKEISETFREDCV